MLSSLWYTIRQAATQFIRNFSMSITALFAITSGLLILGIFFVVVVNLEVALETAKMDYDTVSVYLEDSVSQETANTMLLQFDGMPEVKEVYYLPKDTALEQWKVKSWGDKADLLDTLPENPLPNSIEITVSKLEDADAVVKVAETMDGIEKIGYYKETVDKIIKVTDSIQIGSLIVMAALIFISVIMVSNTIKLTVFARKNEIEIMKYVGATNWFIRGPFLVEGIFMGLLSAGVSAGIIALVYSRIVGVMGQNMALMIGSPMVPVSFLTANLFWVFASLGISIGACGSIISMRRFLDT